jgi:hypothetical protein
MPLPLSDGFLTEKNKLEITDPFVWFVELLSEDESTVYARYTNHVQLITWNSHDWTPWSFQVGSITVSSDGEMQTVQVVVGAAGRSLASALRAFTGLIGKKGNLYKVSKAHLEDPPASVIAHKFVVLTSSESMENVMFNLSIGVDVYGIEGPIGDYDIQSHPHIPYGPARISLGVI